MTTSPPRHLAPCPPRPRESDGDIGAAPATPGPRLDRLRQLRKAVAERPDIQFDMRVWGEAAACGTVCCAAGSYVEAHPDCGLVLVPTGFFYVINEDGGEAVSGTDDVMRILAGHFGIRPLDAVHLFSPIHYPPSAHDDRGRVRKSAVLARIDAMLTCLSD